MIIINLIKLDCVTKLCVFLDLRYTFGLLNCFIEFPLDDLPDYCGIILNKELIVR